jgi:hypothetical protein
MAVQVDAWKTSLTCPRCSYTSADNRDEKGLRLCCQHPDCHLVLRTDLIGARHGALRTLLGRRALQD